MVPHLHQGNDHAKRKLRACRAQICNLFHTAPDLADNGNFRDVGLPIPMIPCLHQGIDYIKNKLRVCRAQKFDLLVGAKTVPPGTGHQTTPFHTAPYRADNGNLRKSCMLNTMVPCLYQGNNYIKRKLRVCRAQKCNLLVSAKTIPPGTGLQTTPFHTAQCIADNGNLRDLGLTYRHGTAFPPRQ